MWAAQGDSEPPESIADLAVGRLLHDYTEAKHGEVQAVLRDGRQWAPAGVAVAAAPGDGGGQLLAAEEPGATRCALFFNGV